MSHAYCGTTTMTVTTSTAHSPIFSHLLMLARLSCSVGRSLIGCRFSFHSFGICSDRRLITCNIRLKQTHGFIFSCRLLVSETHDPMTSTNLRKISKSFSIYVSTEFNEIPPNLHFRCETGINHSLKFGEWEITQRKRVLKCLENFTADPLLPEHEECVENPCITWNINYRFWGN